MGDMDISRDERGDRLLAELAWAFYELGSVGWYSRKMKK
jgi:hypothetical protein